MSIEGSAAGNDGAGVRHPNGRGFSLEGGTVLLLVGVACVAGGVIGMAVSANGLRPESAVYRQVPHLANLIVSAAVFLAGAVVIGAHFLWRAYSEMHKLTNELEEAAALVLLADLDADEPTSANGASSASDRPSRSQSRARR